MVYTRSGIHEGLSSTVRIQPLWLWHSCRRRVAHKIERACWSLLILAKHLAMVKEVNAKETNNFISKLYKSESIPEAAHGRGDPFTWLCVPKCVGWRMLHFRKFKFMLISEKRMAYEAIWMLTMTSTPIYSYCEWCPELLQQQEQEHRSTLPHKLSHKVFLKIIINIAKFILRIFTLVRSMLSSLNS